LSVVERERDGAQDRLVSRPGLFSNSQADQ
jgi:hypothetical protein